MEFQKIINDFSMDFETVTTTPLLRLQSLRDCIRPYKARNTFFFSPNFGKQCLRSHACMRSAAAPPCACINVFWESGKTNIFVNIVVPNNAVDKKVLEEICRVHLIHAPDDTTHHSDTDTSSSSRTLVQNRSGIGIVRSGN